MQAFTSLFILRFKDRVEGLRPDGCFQAIWGGELRRDCLNDFILTSIFCPADLDLLLEVRMELGTEGFLRLWFLLLSILLDNR